MTLEALRSVHTAHSQRCIDVRCASQAWHSGIICRISQACTTCGPREL